MDIIHDIRMELDLQYLTAQLSNILLGQVLELIEEVTPIKVILIDLIELVLGILHPDQDDNRCGYIHYIPDCT